VSFSLTIALLANAALLLQTPVPAPQVTIASKVLTIGLVEVIPDTAPNYRIRVENRSQRSVRVFTIEGSRGGRPAFSGIRAGREGTPILDPGTAYAFEVKVSGGPIDLVAISAVVWMDGTVEGNARRAAEELSSDLGERFMLELLTPLMKRAADEALFAASESVTKLRASIDALPIVPDAGAVSKAIAAAPPLAAMPEDRVAMIAGFAMKRIKTRALTDISPAADQKALQALHDRHAAWLVRLTTGR
jgi:hypothetical protein